MKKQHNKTRMNRKKALFLRLMCALLSGTTIIVGCVLVFTADVRRADMTFLFSAFKAAVGFTAADPQWQTSIFVCNVQSMQTEEIRFPGYQNLDTPFVREDGDWFCSAEDVTDNNVYLLQLCGKEVIQSYLLPSKPMQVVWVNEELYYVSQCTLYRMTLSSGLSQPVRSGLTDESNLSCRQTLNTDGKRLVYSTGSNLRTWYLYDPDTQETQQICKGKFCAGMMQDGSALISSEKDAGDLKQHLCCVGANGTSHSFLVWKRFLWPRLLNENFLIELHIGNSHIKGAPSVMSPRLVSSKTGFARDLPALDIENYSPLELFVWKDQP